MDRVLSSIVRNRAALLRRGARKCRSLEQLSTVRSSSQLSTSYCHSYSLEKLSRGSQNCRSLTWRPDDVTFSSICRRGFASDAGDSGDVVVPFMGDSISEGSVAALLKQPGESVEVDDIVAQIETEKVTIDVRTTVAGTVDKVLVKVGDKVVPGAKIAFIAKGQSSGKPAAPKQEKEAPSPPSAPSPPPPSPPPPSPPKAQEKPAPAPKPAGAGSTEPQKDTKTRLERRVPMTTLRKRIADRLRFSQDTFVQLTTFNEIDMTNLMALRAQYKDAFAEKHGAKLGFLSGFVKATVSALQQQPIVNAVIDGDDIVHRDYIDISIAVATPKGLLVPVVRGAAGMNFAEIEKTISMLAKKANDGKISIDDMAGGTFTISNGGVYGSLCSTPIINPPQSAILGLHAIQKRPVVIGDSIVARPMMQVALTYDHRLIDGREAVLFLRRVKDVVEDPTRLILDV